MTGHFDLHVVTAALIMLARIAVFMAICATGLYLLFRSRVFRWVMALMVAVPLTTGSLMAITNPQRMSLWAQSVVQVFSNTNTQTTSTNAVRMLNSSGNADNFSAINSIVSTYQNAGGLLSLPTTNSGSYLLNSSVSTTANTSLRLLFDPGVKFSGSGLFDIANSVPAQTGPIYSNDFQYENLGGGTFLAPYYNYFMSGRVANQNGSNTNIVAYFGEGVSNQAVNLSAGSWGGNFVGVTNHAGATSWAIEADCDAILAGAYTYCLDAHGAGSFPSTFGLNITANNANAGFSTGIRFDASTFSPINQANSAAATFTGTISGTTLTYSGATGIIARGQIVTGAGVVYGTVILGGAGASWIVSPSQNVSSEAMSSSYSGALLQVFGTNLTSPYGFDISAANFTTAEYTSPSLLIGATKSSPISRISLNAGTGAGASGASIGVAASPGAATTTGDLTLSALGSGNIVPTSPIASTSSISSTTTLSAINGAIFGMLASANSPTIQFRTSGIGSTLDSEILASGGSGSLGSGTIRIVATLATQSILPNTDQSGTVGNTGNRYSNIYAVTYNAGTGNSAGVSCAAGTVSVLTEVITGGIVTHC